MIKGGTLPTRGKWKRRSSSLSNIQTIFNDTTPILEESDSLDNVVISSPISFSKAPNPMSIPIRSSEPENTHNVVSVPHLKENEEIVWGKISPRGTSFFPTEINTSKKISRKTPKSESNKSPVLISKSDSPFPPSTSPSTVSASLSDSLKEISPRGRGYIPPPTRKGQKNWKTICGTQVPGLAAHLSAISAQHSQNSGKKVKVNSEGFPVGKISPRGTSFIVQFQTEK